MSVETWGMIGAGIAALAAGLFLVRARFAVASGAGRILVLGPVFEAVALAIFAAEHFLAARDLSGIVPRWLPGALFWTYFVGAALLAAAISFIAWRCVRWSASLLALLFLIIVVTSTCPTCRSRYMSGCSGRSRCAKRPSPGERWCWRAAFGRAGERQAPRSSARLMMWAGSSSRVRSSSMRSSTFSSRGSCPAFRWGR